MKPKHNDFLRLFSLWTIFSATSFLEKCIKVVLEKCFFKLGFFFLVNLVSPTRKNVDLWYKTTFFSGQPLFLNQKKNPSLQKSG